MVKIRCVVGVALLLPLASHVTARPTPPLDESRVSAIGWTDAHNVAFGWPVVGLPGAEGATEQVPRERATAFLEAASDEFLCRQNDYGQTALHLAVRQDHLAVVSLYTARRICLDVANRDGDTPLHYAAAWVRPAAAKLLVEAGADVSAQNRKGDTPANDARAKGEPDMVRILSEDTVARSCRS